MARESVLKAYISLVAQFDGVEIKGKKMPYTAVNGNMFSFLDDHDRLCLRFSEERKAELNSFHGTTDVIQYGAVMRGYIPLTPETMMHDNELVELFREALAYATSLKPKPTKKKSN